MSSDQMLENYLEVKNAILESMESRKTPLSYSTSYTFSRKYLRLLRSLVKDFPIPYRLRIYSYSTGTAFTLELDD